MLVKADIIMLGLEGGCARILTASRARELPLTRLLARTHFEGLDESV